MKIRKASPADERAVRSLWSYCFEPATDPFFIWYFQRLVHMEEVLVGEEGGSIACDLHLRPYEISVRGHSYQTDYIVASRHIRRRADGGSPRSSCAAASMQRSGKGEPSRSSCRQRHPSTCRSASASTAISGRARRRRRSWPSWGNGQRARSRSPLRMNGRSLLRV